MDYILGSLTPFTLEINGLSPNILLLFPVSRNLRFTKALNCGNLERKSVSLLVFCPCNYILKRRAFLRGNNNER